MRSQEEWESDRVDGGVPAAAAGWLAPGSLRHGRWSWLLVGPHQWVPTGLLERQCGLSLPAGGGLAVPQASALPGNDILWTFPTKWNGRPGNHLPSEVLCAEVRYVERLATGKGQIL